MNKLTPYALLASLAGVSACSEAIGYQAMIVHNSGRTYHPNRAAYEIALHNPGTGHSEGDLADIGIAVLGTEDQIKGLEKSVKAGMAIVVDKDVLNSMPVRFQVGGSILNVATTRQISVAQVTK